MIVAKNPPCPPLRKGGLLAGLLLLAEAAHKPGSVPAAGCPTAGDGHSSGTAVADGLEQPTRKHGRAVLYASLFGLAPGGVYLASGVTAGPGELLPHPFTLTRLRQSLRRADFSLWHFPWGHPRWTLSSTMPCGARTFLPLCRERPSVLLRPNLESVSFPQSLRQTAVMLVRRTSGTPPRATLFSLTLRKIERFLNQFQLLCSWRNTSILWQWGQVISSSTRKRVL